ncbi:MAG: two-component system response regulator [Bacteroidetes bacterium 4572_77]|nr:MAG: two-component system response regulator [Bacteroidetes bacterium 4572_77]
MKKSILIVDDSESIRNLVQFTLKDAGFHVISAENGKEALAQFNGQTIHLLLTDLHMPIMSGMDLIREVRKLTDYKYIPILFLTTETQINIKKEAKEAGATGWIVKPFNAEKLINTLRKVLR